MNMNTVSKTKINVPSGIIVLVLLLVVGVSAIALMSHSHFASPAESADIMVEVQDGHVIDLAHLPQNLILPNGAKLKNIGMQTLSGTEIISAELFSSEDNSPIKLTWLDSNGNRVGYSSHTVLNKPSYYGFYDGDSGIIKIWPHIGAKKVKVEILKD